MNRQEALKKLQKYYDWNYDVEEYSEEYKEEQQQNIEDIIEYLKQPISLTDFLGWEEDVAYNVLGGRYKMVDNKLYWFDERFNKWYLSDHKDNFTDFQQAKKIQPKKYYLRLKKKYRKFYRIMNNLIYLNYNRVTNKLFLLDLKLYKEYQTQFTAEEIEEIKKFDYIPFEQFELIEVGEDE